VSGRRFKVESSRLGVRKSKKSLKYLGLPSPPACPASFAGGDFGGFGAVKKITSFNICSGYSLQSFFASKAGKKRISASIPQPFGRKSLFSFYQSGD
jgi:hypothetical protein